MKTDEERMAIVESIKANSRHTNGRTANAGCPTCGHSSLMILSTYAKDGVLHYVVGCSKCNTACIIDEDIPVCDEVLNIITPCSRPENLELIADNIRKVMVETSVHWHVVLDDHDGERTAPYPSGGFGIPLTVYHYVGETVSPGRMRNIAIRQIVRSPHQWVYFLDDDNCMHPRFRDIYHHMTHQSPVWGFVVSCDAEEGKTLEASPNNLRATLVDMAQLCLNSCLLYDIEFSEWGREEDGVLADKLNAYVGRLGFIKDVASYHDGLDRGFAQ